MQELLARYPALLSREELRTLLGDPIRVDDALERFTRAGVVHRIAADSAQRSSGDFFWCSITAVVTEEAATQDCRRPE